MWNTQERGAQLNVVPLEAFRNVDSGEYDVSLSGSSLRNAMSTHAPPGPPPPLRHSLRTVRLDASVLRVRELYAAQRAAREELRKVGQLRAQR